MSVFSLWKINSPCSNSFPNFRNRPFPFKIKLNKKDKYKNMTKSRLEAFSDGVIAILITIMVMDLKIPSGSDFAALNSISLIFISYILSYVFIGIYWSNHHHLLHSVHEVNGKILWLNLHLLFWLSLIPFVTNWMGKNFLSPWPWRFTELYYLCPQLLIIYFQEL